MITRDEIEAKASEFGLHPSNIERDYVFGWLLTGIYGQSTLKDALVLKGGNCFRKAYFPHTRFSNDLDFSSTAVIDENQLVAELNRICGFVQAEAGVTFETDRNWVREKANSDKDRRIFEGRLYFKDFYGNPHTTTLKVHLDVTEYDRIFLPVQDRLLIHPYSDGTQCNVPIRCQKLEELLASKLKCLLQRRHSFDLYDYVYSVFINQDILVDRSEILRTFLKKTIFEPSPGVAKGLLLDLPLEAFRTIWHKYIVCPTQSLFDFDTALGRFKENIETLFAGLHIDYYGQIAFFPSKLRTSLWRLLAISECSILPTMASVGSLNPTPSFSNVVTTVSGRNIFMHSIPRADDPRDRASRLFCTRRFKRSPLRNNPTSRECRSNWVKPENSPVRLTSVEATLAAEPSVSHVVRA